MIQPSSPINLSVPSTEMHTAEMGLNNIFKSAKQNEVIKHLMLAVQKSHLTRQDAYNRKLYLASQIVLRRPERKDLHIRKLENTEHLLTTAKLHCTNEETNKACDLAINHLKTWQEKLALDAKNNHFIYRL